MAKYIDADRLIRWLENSRYRAKGKIIDMINEQEAAETKNVPDTNVGDTISRQDALDAVFNNAEHPNKAYEAIRHLPSAERHGRWIEEYSANHLQAKCSACGKSTLYGISYDLKGNAHYMNYCPNCGASMMDDNAIQHTECVENALGALAELENGIYGVRDGQVYKMRCATPEELFPNAKKVKINLMAATEEEEDG